MIVRETSEVKALYAGVKRVLDLEDSNSRKIGDCTCGVYLFSDYDGEPIYVGQTAEKLRTRIRRHLTNQRTDAVAMSVLDPFEVSEIEMWPYWGMVKVDKKLPTDDKATLDRAEFTVYQRAIEASKFKVILNEKEIAEAPLIDLPPSVKGQILPAEDRRAREHPDVRLARRARTIANLARVISERKVELGIRRTLWAQAMRLEHLADSRVQELEKKK